MSDQELTFSWARDIKDVNWPGTLKYNALRAAAAGLVWCILELLMGVGPAAFTGIVALPVGYFIFLLPVGLVTNWMSSKGVPWVGLVNIMFALLLVVGDPLVYALKKLKPEFIPVERVGFLNFKIIIFVIDQHDAPVMPTEKREVSAELFVKK